MANPKRKAAHARPITAHPLFPAVVALWFGALFGLGSLAVRPSLLESVVIASRIDLLVPAAAPPLGVTARILMALGMAALGAVIGIVIARRMTRPKVEVRQRKRTGVARDEAPLQYRARDAHPDAPARRPISINDELGADGADFGTGVLSGRRRSLAVELPEQAFVPHDMAPLPGGAPQIFDLADMDAELSAEPDLSAAPADPVSPLAAPLDLGAFAQPGEPRPLSPPADFDPPKFQPSAPPVTLDWAAAQPTETAPATPLAPLEMPAAMQARDVRQVFQAAEPAAEPVADQAETAEPRQIFGLTAHDDHLPQEFVQAAGFKTSVFEVEEPQPLFPGRAAAPPPLAPAAEADTPALAADPLPPLGPPLGSLAMADLATRLAESMRRRRAARDAALAAPATAAAIASEPADPAFEAAPYTPFAQYAPSEPIPAPFAPARLEAAAPVAEPVAAAEPAPAALVPLGAVPLAEVPPAPLAMPAALRPISFDEPLDGDDDDILASLLPPRTMAMPVPATAPEEPVGDDDVAAEDEKFGSLLDLGLGALVRPQFVRIEDPDADSAATEPVVIFPGQGALAAQAPAFAAAAMAAAPAPQSAPADSAPFRRFDAPASVGHGQPIASMAATPMLDPAETDRALRAALANLQRMSGAA